jgi:hypothetical protein
MHLPVKILATAVVAGSAWLLAGSAGAMPLAASLSLRDASTPLAQTVQWRRRGWGVGAGIVAGAIVGGAIARSSYYYGGYPAYSYGYGGYSGYSYGYPAYSYDYASPAYSYGGYPGYSYGYASPAYSGYAYAPRVYRRWRGW